MMTVPPITQHEPGSVRLHWRFFKVSPHDTIAPPGLFIVKRARRETSDGAPVLVAFMETLSVACHSPWRVTTSAYGNCRATCSWRTEKRREIMNEAVVDDIVAVLPPLLE